MLGFTNRSDVPRLVIGFLVAVVILCAGAGIISLLRVHGSLFAVLILAVFVAAYKGGEWAGEAIWDRIGGRF